MKKDELLQSCAAYEQLCYKTAAGVRPSPAARLRFPMKSPVKSFKLAPIIEPSARVSLPKATTPILSTPGVNPITPDIGPSPRMGLGKLPKPQLPSPELSSIMRTTEPIPSVGEPLTPSPDLSSSPKGKALLEWIKGVGGVAGEKLKSIKDAPQKIQELYQKLMTPGNKFILPDEKNIWRDETGKIKFKKGIFDSEGNIKSDYSQETLAAELQARDAIDLQSKQAAQAAKQKAANNLAKIQEMAKNISASKSPMGQAKSLAWKALSVAGALGFLYQTLTTKSPQSTSKDKKEIINYLSSEKSSEELSIKNTNENIRDLNQSLSNLKNKVGDKGKATLDKVILKNNELSSNLSSVDAPLSLDDASSLKGFASKISALEPKVIKHIINLQKLKVVLANRGDIEHAQKCDILINSLIEKLAIIQSARESIG